MSLFRKQKQPDSVAGRRRPLSSEQSANRAQAFSYYAQRSTAAANTGRGQGGDTETSRRNGAIRAVTTRPLLALSLVVVGITGVYMLGLVGKPQVILVNNGNTTYYVHDEKAYEAVASDAIGISPLNKNKLTVDTLGISAELTENFPELKSATVSLSPWSQRAKVLVEPYRPAFILTTATGTAYLIDENGRALVPASQIDGMENLRVPTIQDKSGLDVKAGSQALSSSAVRFTEIALGILKSAKVEYGQVVLPSAAHELHVSLKNVPYFVKFNFQEDVRQQVGTYLAAKARLEKDGVVPAEYIDVRVPERAYYK
jgi:hypothetical protein